MARTPKWTEADSIKINALLRIYSQRKVAVFVGLSRGTVARIGSNKHLSREGTKDKIKLDNEGAEFLENGSLARCLECGAKVRMPCHACKIRKGMKLRGGIKRL